jgi:hypothetical protein
VYKVQTLLDGGIRITLDLPETAIPQAAMLMECKREGIPLVFAATIDDKLNIQESNAKPKLETGGKRKSEWTTAGPTGIN